MIKFEIADLIAVLELCAPYLIALGVAIIFGIGVMIACGKMSPAKKFLIRGETGLAMVLVIAIIVNIISFGPLSTLIRLSTGKKSISSTGTTLESSKVAEEVAQEGFVLLQNDGLLPLKDGNKLNLFGWASANPLYGGAGSGGINDKYEIVSLSQGLQNSGFAINQELSDFYTKYSSARPEMSIQKQSWTLPEPPVSTYPEELVRKAKDFSDVAVVVLSRMAGEGHTDMPKDVNKVAFENNSKEYKDFSTGEHYLQLSQTEEDMINMVCKNFNKVVVVYNGANPLELGFVNKYSQIKSVLWAPGPGNVGFNALGKIMRGTVNPSGKTTDTFVYDNTASPWWNNWVKNDYSNMKQMTVEGMNSGRPENYSPSFINYVEGIYVGYKYFETAAEEGILNYEKTVQYTFGHGLSYTTFTQKMGSISEKKGTISFDVTVTNTGSVAGKDVVEVYYKPPYKNGGIEKASANLVAFEKTQLLEPGKSQTITITFNVEDMASYDYVGAKAYVLEEGDYTISINKDSHAILDKKVYKVKSTVTYNGKDGRSSDKTTATNQFDDAAGDVNYLSREDHFANYKTVTAAPASLELSSKLASEYHLNSNYDYTKYINKSDVMPTTGANNGLTLSEFLGASYDDPRWEKLLDQMTIDEMKNLIGMAGYQTPAVKSVGKVATVDADGPAAINNNFTKAGSIGFPVEVVIANTWSQELAEKYGECMGKMAKEMNITGWYAPGMNTHRVPFGARNYEYFSEDGILAGRIAAKAVNGARKYGVYSFIKHFALYDTNGKMVSIWANEQAIREIYLRPFEISIKEGNANALMVAWNFLGNKWVGENSKLMNTVLRDEWGFRGMTLTDFFRNNGHGFMNADMALSGGVDAMLSTFEGGPNNVKDSTAATTVKAMRRASKNILYTVVNSWAYGSDDPSRNNNSNTKAEIGMLPWQKAEIGIDVFLGVILLMGSIVIYKRYRKMSK